MFTFRSVSVNANRWCLGAVQLNVR